MLWRENPAHLRLLLVLANEDQWRRLSDRLLPRRAARLLHLLPGNEYPVLTDPLLVTVMVGSVVAGLSTMFGP
jgi:hypothetical protein